jgi:hypothetical protein
MAISRSAWSKSFGKLNNILKKGRCIITNPVKIATVQEMKQVAYIGSLSSKGHFGIDFEKEWQERAVP